MKCPGSHSSQRLPLNREIFLSITKGDCVPQCFEVCRYFNSRSDLNRWREQSPDILMRWRGDWVRVGSLAASLRKIRIERSGRLRSTSERIRQMAAVAGQAGSSET